ncbi:MAG TPA: hypothetical protein VE973_02085, partial [Candidatus Limnocylindria bacterium]|nr:hypothetical protein [Candidatus Limnocylindria bacterium]
MKQKFNLTRITKLLPFVAIAFLILIVPTHQAKAVLFNASGLLGHYDDHDNPVYTTSTADNIWTPNGRGFSYPAGAALDTTNHRLFVSDYSNHRVMVFQLDTSNNPLSAIATYVLGQPDFNSSNTAANRSSFNFPYGVQYDSQNTRLFAEDQGNNRVLVFDVNPSTITNGENASYVLGQSNFTSSVATSTQSGMLDPSDAVYDSANTRLFVSDIFSNRILVFNVATSTIANGMNASYVLGQANFTVNVATTTQSGLYNPEGLGYDSGNQRLFVTDAHNYRVMVFNVATSTIANGENASNVLGQSNFTSASSGITQSKFDGLELNILYDSTNGNLFVSDGNNNRIMIFDVNSITNGEAAVGEMGEYNDDDTPNYTKKAADNVSTPNARGFDGPYGTTLDTKNHRLFVGDVFNHRVLVFGLDSSNNPSSAIASYVLGQPDFNSNTPSTTQNSINIPSSISYDSIRERLFVVDGSTARNFRVMIFNVDPSTIASGENASYVLGQTNFTSKVATTTQSHFGNPPQAAAYDSVNDRLFIGESGPGSRVLVFNTVPAVIANGENASYVLGQANFTAQISTTTQSGLSDSVEDLAYDASNQRLFVSDSNNNRILIFNVAPSVIANGENASYVLGQNNFTSNA